MKLVRLITAVLFVSVLFALLMPGLATAADENPQFENPLGINNPKVAIENILGSIILFILGLSALVALATLVYGGLRLILGASLSESEIARAKQMIFWAIIGLVVIGMAAAILKVVQDVLF